jgi:methyltransferase (TIGR00027 family)
MIKRNMKENKPSATAYLIARSTLFLSRDPLFGQLVPERSAELCEQFVHARPLLARLADAVVNSRLLRPLAKVLEHLTIPGLKLHYALRKRCLEELVRDALRDGFSQVVVIGAGFDTLALRLHEQFPETKFFEIDHPATQSVKRRVLRQRGTGDNLRFVSLDLARGSLDESLLLPASGYLTDARTLFLAEGLLMYLSTEEIDLIFGFIRAHSVANSRFAFTFMETQDDGRIGFRESSRAVDAWLRLRGESFKWGSGRGRINDFLKARGFAPREVITSETLRKRYLAKLQLRDCSLADGECLCLAELS